MLGERSHFGSDLHFVEVQLIVGVDLGDTVDG